jgi:hypothetical protein
VLPTVVRALRLALTRTIFRVDRRGRVTIAFTTNPNVAGTAELQSLPRRARAAQRRLAARVRFRSNARGRATVRLRLGASARRSLRRARTGRLRARMVIRAGGRSSVRQITLRRR